MGVGVGWGRRLVSLAHTHTRTHTCARERTYAPPAQTNTQKKRFFFFNVFVVTLASTHSILPLHRWETGALETHGGTTHQGLHSSVNKVNGSSLLVL